MLIGKDIIIVVMNSKVYQHQLLLKLILMEVHHKKIGGFQLVHIMTGIYKIRMDIFSLDPILQMIINGKK
jgi:hypothetical protein